MAGAHRPAAVPGRVVVPAGCPVGRRSPTGHPAQAARRTRHAASLRRARPRRAVGTRTPGDPGPRGRGPDDPRDGGRRRPDPWLVPAGGCRAHAGGVPGAGAARDDLVQVPPGRHRAPARAVRPAARVHPGRAGVHSGVPPAAARAVRLGGCAHGIEPAGRQARAVHRLHRGVVASGGHVRHPLRDRGPGDLGAGAGRGRPRRRQERAARAADLRGGPARHPLGGPRPLRATRATHRAAGAARAQRAPRPHRGGQRNAEPVRRGGLSSAQRLPDRRCVRRGRGAGRPGPQAARDGCHQDAAATLGERPAADLAGHLGRGPGHRR